MVPRTWAWRCAAMSLREDGAKFFSSGNSLWNRSFRCRIAAARYARRRRGRARAGNPVAQSAAAADASGGAQVLCRPQVIGYRRIPPDSVLARIASHQGDPYDAATVERDFNSLWNTGYFEKIQIERADTPSCVQLVIYVREKPTIRSIDYQGMNAITQSDVQDRYKKAKVGIDGGEPVRSDAGEAGRGRAEGPVERAWTPVRDHPDRGKDDPSVVGGDHLPNQGRADGEGGEDRLRRQLQPEQPRAAPCDGEFAADRDPALDPAGEFVGADLRRQQTGRGHGTGAHGVRGPRLLQGGDGRSADPCARRGRTELVYAAAFDRQAHRHPDSGGGGGTLPAGWDQLYRQQDVQQHQGAAGAVRAEGRRVVLGDVVLQGAEGPAQGVRRLRLHQHGGGPEAALR